MKTRLVRPHTCGDVPAGWEHAWWLTGEYAWRDAIGRKTDHGRHRWLIMECVRSTGCEAQALVLATTVEDEAVRQLNQPQEGPN